LAYSRYTDRVCVSESVMESFENRFLLPANTVYNPIDTDMIFSRSRERVALPPKTRIRFVTSGRLVGQKGYDRLLHTAARLRDAGADFELWILGDGMQMETLCDYIEAMDLEDRVTMWGYVANPYPLVASADVFVCSSRSEGYSTAATEAIILGVPVVTTLCAGMRELLGDGKYGIIVDNKDDALYEPLKKMTDDPAIIADLRRRARERSRDFALPAMMAPIEELLNPTQKSQ
jgi:glycosyltransferase involved in cell wall biosynthesis